MVHPYITDGGVSARMIKYKIHSRTNEFTQTVHSGSQVQNANRQGPSPR